MIANSKRRSADRLGDQHRSGATDVDRRKALGRLAAYTAPAMLALLAERTGRGPKRTSPRVIIIADGERGPLTARRCGSFGGLLDRPGRWEAAGRYFGRHLTPSRCNAICNATAMSVASPPRAASASFWRT